MFLTKELHNSHKESKNRWKELTTIFNKSGTLFVLNYRMPCNVQVTISDISFEWRMVHFEKGYSFAIGSEFLTPPKQRNTNWALSQTPCITKIISKTQEKIVNFDIGLLLLKICIQRFFNKHPNPRFRVADLCENLSTYTTTRSSPAQIDGNGKKWKDFTTLLKKPHTLFVLDYTLPCDIREQNKKVAQKRATKKK